MPKKRGHGWSRSKSRKSTTSGSCEVVPKKTSVKPKQKTTHPKRKKKRGHGWSRSRKPHQPSVPTPTPTPTPTPFEVVAKNIHVPTPTPKHETKPKCKKRRGHGRRRGGKSAPSRSCEVTSKEIRYQFFKCSYPINSPRPNALTQIKLRERLGAPIYELLTSNENGDFNHEVTPSRCSCPECPYITGYHRHQIRLLLCRLSELLYNN